MGAKIQKKSEDSNGYAIIQRSIIQNPAVSDNAFRVYSLLSAYIGNNKDCWPSISTIQKKLNRSYRTIERAIKKLEELGIIEVDRSDGKCNHYLNTPDKIDGGNNHTPDKIDSAPLSEMSGVTPVKNDTLLITDIINNNITNNIPTVQTESLPPEDKGGKKGKQRKNPNPEVYNEIKGIWLDWYKQQKGNPWYWTGKDGKALTQIINKLNFFNQKAGDGAAVADLFRHILGNIRDRWILDNLSPSVINGKFNEICAQIKGEVDPYAELKRKYDIK